MSSVSVGTFTKWDDDDDDDDDDLTGIRFDSIRIEYNTL